MLELATCRSPRPASADDRSKAELSSELLSSLLSISKTTRAYYGLKLAPLGFPNGQGELLVAISDRAVSVSIMADQLSVRPSTVSKMLDRLIEKGLCERSIDPCDARKSLVQITPTGIEVRKKIVQLRREVEADLVKHLDAEACKAMTRMLSDCADHLVRELRRIR